MSWCILEGMRASGDQWRLGRRPGLDGLRGVAIGLVLIAHVWPSRLDALGTVGVTLFFGLSGFLITALLLDEHAKDRGVSLRRFYVRRARRLLPALVPVLITASVIMRILGGDPRAELIFVLTYSSNWATAFGLPMTLLAHTWSLAVEEQFYLVWPVVLAVALQRGVCPGRIARWSLAGAGVSVLLRFTLWGFGAAEDFIDAGTFTRADALLVGCALAAALHADWRPGRLEVLACAVPVGVLGVGYAAASDLVPWRIALPTLTMLAAAPLLLFSLSSPRALSGPVLRWLGRRSYALYLWHYVLVVSSNWHLWPLPTWGALALSLAAAEVSWWLVERPFTKRSVVAAGTPGAALVGLRRRPETA